MSASRWLYWPLLISVATALWLGPRLVEARAALAWTRWHAARAVAASRPGPSLRETTRHARHAITSGAPLPDAQAAAVAALDTARAVAPRDAAQSRQAARQLREAIEAMVATGWRGVGLRPLLAEARRLEAGE